MVQRQKDWFITLLVIPVLSWATNTLASASPDSGTVQEWLERISDSTKRYNFEGTFVYRCNTQLVALKIIHGITEDGERQKLISLNGPAQQVFNENQSVVAMLPQKRQSVVKAKKESGYLPGNALSNKKALDVHYELSLKGIDRVAGRTTKMVNIFPKDDYRYGFKLWVDEESGIVLRSDMVDKRGEIIEQVMFTDIRFIDDERALTLLGETVESPDIAINDAEGVLRYVEPENRAWSVADLPAGFLLEEHYRRQGRDDYPAHEQMVFTDGLASVSVFIEKNKDDVEPFVGRSRMGAMNAFGSLVEGYQVTVVGDVPTATVELIGGSVQRAASVDVSAK